MQSNLPIHPQSLILLQRVAAQTAAVPAAELTIARRRRLARDAEQVYQSPDGPIAALRSDLTLALPGRALPARLYKPKPSWAPTAARDVLLVYFHGGGWVAGDLETHDNACAFLTRELGCGLLSVEYRKAPEHPFPLPCDDALDAYRAAAAQAPAWGYARLAISGDSAGAHLASHAMHAADDIATAAALLFYPVADMDFNNASYRRSTAGPGLTGTAMYWFWEQYLGAPQPLSPPPDDVRILTIGQRWTRKPPPTVVALAWHDPLHDEGLAYAEMLANAGAHVHTVCANDMAHGFIRQCSANPAAAVHVRASTDAMLTMLTPA